MIAGLLMDPDCARAGTAPTVKTRLQRDFAECIYQISLYPRGCEVLKAWANAAVVEALDRLVAGGSYSDEAKDCARGALMQLTDRLPPATAEEFRAELADSQPHIMMSYQWDAQVVVKRIVADLQGRGYLVWFDLERMKGSVMDAMSAAVEGAELMLFGVSEKYLLPSLTPLQSTHTHTHTHTPAAAAAAAAAAAVQ